MDAAGEEGVEGVLEKVGCSNGGRGRRLNMDSAAFAIFGRVLTFGLGADIFLFGRN